MKDEQQKWYFILLYLLDYYAGMYIMLIISLYPLVPVSFIMFEEIQ